MSSTMVTGIVDKCKNNSFFLIGIIFLVLVIVFVVFCTCTETGKRMRERFMGNPDSSDNITKDLDIIMFMSPTCPWCKKMIEVIKSENQLNNIQVVDMSKPEGLEIAKQFGADKQPVPSYISKKLKTGTVGFKNTVSELIESLQNTNNGDDGPEPETESVPVDPNEVQDLQIVLFARDGCGWCEKAKEAINKAGITDHIQIVDFSSSEGQQLAQELLPPDASGVPAWASISTRKSVIGYKPLHSIVAELK